MKNCLSGDYSEYEGVASKGCNAHPPWVRVGKGSRLGGPVEGWAVPTPYNNIKFNYYKDINIFIIELSMIGRRQRGQFLSFSIPA